MTSYVSVLNQNPRENGTVPIAGNGEKFGGKYEEKEVNNYLTFFKASFGAMFFM